MGVFLSGGYGRLLAGSFGVTGALRPRTARRARDTKHMTAMSALARVHQQIVTRESERFTSTVPTPVGLPGHTQ